MAKTITLLVALNNTLRRAGAIQSNLTSFTDTGLQVRIDNGLAAINDTLIELQKTPGAYRGEIAKGTIELVADDRDYATPSDFVMMADERSSLIDRTNGRRLRPYPGDYLQLVEDQLIPGNYTGAPNAFTIDEDDEIYLDRIPQSADAGKIYTFFYRVAVNLTATGNTFPVDDEVVRRLYGAFSEWYRFIAHKQINQDLFQRSLSAAAHLQRIGGSSGIWSNRKVRRVGVDGWPYD